ncbi:tail sheath protein [Vibrio phage 2.275.O._10N.286.54.E11]|nr:tail sheath protein [Vibrio phage 2.275.O._10N.286.54.E11]
MALISPGVEVTITDDSAYPASSQGTVPLIFIATAQDKLVPGGNLVAEGTTKANANKPYLLTSQSDALNFFGSPIFQEDNGTVLQGDELNEWGLHSLYSTLGVTNQAWAVRADIDLQELEPTQVEPRNVPVNQTYWVNTSTSTWGLKIWNNVTANGLWESREVLIPSLAEVDGVTLVPNPAFGGDPQGDVDVDAIYAVVPYVSDGTNAQPLSQTGSFATHQYFRKRPGDTEWTNVTDSIDFQRMNAPTATQSGQMWVKLDSPANGMSISVGQYQTSTDSWTNPTCLAGSDLVELEAAWGPLLSVGSLGFTANDGVIKRKSASGTVFSAFVDLAATYNGTTSPVGTVTVRYHDGILPFAQEKTFNTVATDDYSSFLSKLDGVAANIIWWTDSTNDGTAVQFRSVPGFEFVISSDAGSLLADPIVPASTWVDLVHYGQDLEPTTLAVADELWFDDSLYADLMITDGQQWKSFASYFETAPNALDGKQTWVFSQSQPDTIDRVGLPNDALVNGDIWIDPVDGANFDFYVFSEGVWKLLDQTDQSTTEGILFADLRQSDGAGVGYLSADSDVAKEAFRKGELITDGEGDEYSSADFVDPDAPEPRLYPAGMICLNTRASGGVVRKLVLDAFEEELAPGVNTYRVGNPTDQATGNSVTFTLPGTVVSDASSRTRWVTESGNSLDGSGLFGRNAQRKVVVEALASTIVGNQEIRSEFMEFNLLVAPGYVELLDELVTLNTDRRETAYIITDVPARLEPTGTVINNWAKNANNAPSNGDVGRTTAYAYSAEYMGWCLGTNVDGKEVAIPGSSVALRTYVYSDSVSYPWFPPAGTQRGIVTNAASVGYINSENEYEPVVYNQGQRDVMYENGINPIALRPGRGLLVYGDKSLSPDATALDRVNVGRLVVYIRTEIEKIAERFLFELNTARVREEFAGALNAFLSNIVQLEGLYDYSVICDTSNNTPARIDQNMLWADIAIQPTKSINFIHVPIRIQNTE